MLELRKTEKGLDQIKGAGLASQAFGGQGRQSEELGKGNMQNYLESLLLTILFC